MNLISDGFDKTYGASDGWFKTPAAQEMMSLWRQSIRDRNSTQETTRAINRHLIDEYIDMVVDI